MKTGLQLAPDYFVNIYGAKTTTTAELLPELPSRAD